MIVRSLGKSFLILPFLSACISTTEQESGLQAADDVVVRIERVYVDCELTREIVSGATDSLRAIASPDFEGDAVAAHTAYMQVVEDCEAHAAELRVNVDLMNDSAEPFFEQWEVKLRDFAGAEMRQRSRDHLLSTREHYEAIVSATRPLLADYDGFNLSLRDVALFLGHDFNAVGDIEPEVQSLMQLARFLNENIDASLGATRGYIELAGLPIRVETGDE